MQRRTTRSFDGVFFRHKKASSQKAHATTNYRLSAPNPTIKLFAAFTLVAVLALFGGNLGFFLVQQSLAHADSGRPVDVWWPRDGLTSSGTEPFKAMVPGLAVEQYEMYWQVDNGSLNQEM